MGARLAGVSKSRPRAWLSGRYVPLLNAGERANVSWQVTGVLSCEVTGNNGDGTGSNETGVWSGASGAQISSPITAQTIYTLTCIGLDDSTVTRSATVNITPIFQEL